jgi:membrane associated rhomboid family serine protease
MINDFLKVSNKKDLSFVLIFLIFLLSVHIGSNQLLRVIGKSAFIDIFAVKPDLRPQIGHITAIFIHIDRGHIVANMLIAIVSFPIALRYTDIKSVFCMFMLGGIFGFVTFSIVGDIVDHQRPTVGASGGLYSVMSNCLVLKLRSIKSSDMLIYSIIPVLFITVEIIRAFVLTNPLLISDDEMINLVHSTGVVSGYIFTVILIYKRKNLGKF